MAREDIAVMDGPEAAPSQAPQQAAQGPAMGEPQQASPEEQAQYNHFVAKAMDLTYERKFLPQVLEMLRSEDPMEGLSQASAMIVARVATAAEQAGEKLSGDVALHAATEVFEDLAELSREAGIKDYSEDQDALEGAYFRMLDHLRVMMEQAGRINRDAAQQDMQKLQEMDQNGELEQMFTRLAESESAEEQPPADKGKPKGGLMQGRAQ